MTLPTQRIAIADDELDMREFLGKVLPRMGHTVVAAAENGAQLIEDCRRTHPDLIITDLKMPVCDGVAALTQIWRESAVPAIVISAYPEQWTQGPLAASPWVTMLRKPVGMGDLEPAIRTALARFGATAPHRHPPN